MDKKSSVLFLGDVVPFKTYKFKNTYKTVLNLECPIVKGGKPEEGKIILKVEENYLNNIFGDYLLSACLANNHILDFGKNGLDATIAELEKLNTSWFGIIQESETKQQPLILEIDKLKIAFLATVCPTTSPVTVVNGKKYLSLLNHDDIYQDIRDVRKVVDRIVIYIHWGLEESSYPEKNDVLTARKLIDSGADIVIGCHAHSPQSVEKYKNGVIAYSLGNFIMPKLKKQPTYYNEQGIALSTYTKQLLLWNRISWGLIIDFKNLDFKIKKYIFLFNRIVELSFTPYDRYIRLNTKLLSDSSDEIIRKHLARRALYRKIIGFINNPYIPQKLKRML